MPHNSKPARPIIVINKKASHGGHHGGAWKVAYADFVTAMMSLFIVLWLMNSTPQIKKSVAGYFNDPTSSGKETGTKILGSNESISIDQTNVEKLKEEIEKAILKQTDLTRLSKQIEITVTGEGLRIELIEDKGGTFFETGSPKLSENGDKLLHLLSAQLKTLPNRLLIEGHTDAQPFSDDASYTNWELSSDRANSARRLLRQDGLGQNQISQVRGYADQHLRVASNPLDPSNRRISLIVQWLDAGTPSEPVEPVGPETVVNSEDPHPPSATGAPPSAATKQNKSSPSSSIPHPAIQAAVTSSGWMAHMRSLVPLKKK